MADPLVESLKCAICLDYATDAVEVNCCGQVYCESCLTGITSGKCPSCNSVNLAFTTSKTLRRQIAYLPADCPNGCEQKTTRGELKRHMQICPNTEYVCPIETCCDTEKFSGKESKYADHLMSVHRRHVFTEVAKSAEKVECKFPECTALVAKSLMYDHICSVHDKDITSLVKGVEKEQCKFPGCRAMVAKSLMSEHIWTVHDNDIASIGKVQCPVYGCIYGRHLMSGELIFNHLTGTHQKQLCDKMKNIWYLSNTEPFVTKNERGNSVNMAHNGKFYCGKVNTVWAKDTYGNYGCHKKCDVNTEEGVNCDACMKLDVMFRNLPYGFLVNGKGKVCAPKPCSHELKDNGTFFDRRDKRFILCHKSMCGKSPSYHCGDRLHSSGETNYQTTLHLNQQQYCKVNDGACGDCKKIAGLMGLSRQYDPKQNAYNFVWQT